MVSLSALKFGLRVEQALVVEAARVECGGGIVPGDAVLGDERRDGGVGVFDEQRVVADAEAENKPRALTWPTKLAVADPEAVSVDGRARPPENAALALAPADRVELGLNSVSRANSSAANSAPENSARGSRNTASYPRISPA